MELAGGVKESPLANAAATGEPFSRSRRWISMMAPGHCKKCGAPTD